MVSGICPTTTSWTSVGLITPSAAWPSSTIRCGAATRTRFTSFSPKACRLRWVANLLFFSFLQTLQFFTVTDSLWSRRSPSTPTLAGRARCGSWRGSVMACGCPSGWIQLCVCTTHTHTNTCRTSTSSRTSAKCWVSFLFYFIIHSHGDTTGIVFPVEPRGALLSSQVRASWASLLSASRPSLLVEIVSGWEQETVWSSPSRWQKVSEFVQRLIFTEGVIRSYWH